jgi:lipoprotein NlpI
MTKIYKGEMDAAEVDFSKALGLNSNDLAAYLGLGTAKECKGEMDAADADFSKAIALQPGFLASYVSRGQERKAKGDLDGALSDYDKAIEINPKYSTTYQYRGCLRYDSQAFPEALLDFRQECDLNFNSDDAHLRIWLVRSRTGEKNAATRDLQEYLKNRKTGTPGDWRSQIALFLMDQMTEPDFFKAAESKDPKKEKNQHFEALFFAGAKRLVDGDKTAAAGYFQKCVAASIKDTMEYQGTEYQSAEAELRFLKAAK